MGTKKPNVALYRINQFSACGSAGALGCYR